MRLQCIFIIAPYLVFCDASRFQIQGPIVTVTLKDPYEKQTHHQANIQHSRAKMTETESRSQRQFQENQNVIDDDEGGDQETHNSISSASRKRWYRKLPLSFQKQKQQSSSLFSNVFNIPSLSPTMLYGIRSVRPPLPNYLPFLRSTSVTASYNYHDLHDAPNFIEGDMRLSSSKLNVDMDVGASYNVKQKATALSVRLGTSSSSTSIAPTNSEENSNEESQPTATPRPKIAAGCSVLAQMILSKGKRTLSHIRGQYTLNFPPSWTMPSSSGYLSPLPFSLPSSLTITPTYSFLDENDSRCTIVAKSASGRTASILDLNFNNPTLSVMHALDHRHTIQPEISLLDAKILYNWDIRLYEGRSNVKVRVDPMSCVQVSWVDESLSRNGKWVTDLRLPLNGNSVSMGESNNGAMRSQFWKSDIRVRRQFIF